MARTARTTPSAMASSILLPASAVATADSDELVEDGDPDVVGDSYEGVVDVLTPSIPIVEALIGAIEAPDFSVDAGPEDLIDDSDEA